MDKSKEPQRIQEEKEFLHELSNPLTTALALASKAQNDRLVKALEQIIDLVKTRRQQLKDLEN